MKSQVGDAYVSVHIFQIEDLGLHLLELLFAIGKIARLVFIDVVVISGGGHDRQAHTCFHSVLESKVFVEVHVGPVVDQLDALVRGSDAVHAAEALHDAHGVPVDVVVDHHVAVLQVLPLADAVRGDQDVDVAILQPRVGDVAFLGLGAETGEDVAHVAADLPDRAPAGPRTGYLRRLKTEGLGVFADVFVQVVGGIGERGEYEDLPVALINRMLLLVPDGPVQALELGVMLGVDVPNHGEELADDPHVALDVGAPALPVHVRESKPGPALGGELDLLRVILVEVEPFVELVRINPVEHAKALVLVPVLLVFVDDLHCVVHVPVDALQSDAEGVHAAFETFQEVGGHELAHTGLTPARGQSLDLILVEILGPRTFMEELGWHVQGKLELFQLVIDSVVGHGIRLGGQLRTDCLRLQAFGEITDRVHVVIAFDMPAAARHGHLVENLEEIKVQTVHQILGSALLRVELRPRAVCLLRVAEHGIDVRRKPELFRPIVVVALVGQCELVLQVAEPVVHRGRGQHQHFRPHAPADNLLQKLLVPVLLVVRLNRGIIAVAEVVRLIDHHQVIVAPVDHANVDAHVRWTLSTVQIGMEQYVVAQTILAQRVVDHVGAERHPVVLELLRAQHEHVAVTRLEVFDYSQRGKSLSQTHRVRQNTPVVGLKLIDDGQCCIPLEVVQLVPDHAIPVASAFLGQYILVDVVKKLAEDAVQGHVIHQFGRILPIHLADTVDDLLCYILKLSAIPCLVEQL